MTTLKEKQQRWLALNQEFENAQGWGHKTVSWTLADAEFLLAHAGTGLIVQEAMKS